MTYLILPSFHNHLHCGRFYIVTSAARMVNFYFWDKYIYCILLSNPYSFKTFQHSIDLYISLLSKSHSDTCSRSLRITYFMSKQRIHRVGIAITFGIHKYNTLHLYAFLVWLPCGRILHNADMGIRPI